MDKQFRLKKLYFFICKNNTGKYKCIPEIPTLVTFAEVGKTDSNTV